ncbi:MAG: outer membrane beta-barrel protein [Saprospiraceae bacterium]|nr:outer membrane beta-barrel protein [Saprospiraceae bacterium]
MKNRNFLLLACCLMALGSFAQGLKIRPFGGVNYTFGEVVITEQQHLVFTPNGTINISPGPVTTTKKVEAQPGASMGVWVQKDFGKWFVESGLSIRGCALSYVHPKTTVVIINGMPTEARTRVYQLSVFSFGLPLQAGLHFGKKWGASIGAQANYMLPIDRSNIDFNGTIAGGNDTDEFEHNHFLLTSQANLHWSPRQWLEFRLGLHQPLNDFYKSGEDIQSKVRFAELQVVVDLK